MDEYNKWLKYAVKDKDLIKELLEIKEDEGAINDRFYRDLEFGTGGLRGIIGAGTNRMNIYTVMKATQGLANYLNKSFTNSSVAIAYDSRIKSDMFSKFVAGVLSANNINVYIYSELMPTPSLSYAVGYLNCNAGICVTASHNPANYNGYKVYGEDGCQITLDMANDIIKEINKIDIFNDVKYQSFEEAKACQKVNYIKEEVIDSYLDEVAKLSLNRSFNNLKIVYSPLNGTGKKCVLKILQKQGFNDINLVREQADPDGRFPTCPFPNPEKKEALELGIKLAKELDADLVLATDPDADRVGIAVKYCNDYQLITGNEMGVLLLNYICENKKMPNNPVCVKTIVTTDMINQIGKEYNVTILNTLTGFKFIGEQIGVLEKLHRLEDYIFGFEESYGYLSGTHVRDKDAVNACMLICEMISFYKNKSLNLIDKLYSLYDKYGYYKNELVDYTFAGQEGMEKINSIMRMLRNNSYESINNVNVETITDYSKKQPGLVDLPLSNVLKFNLNNDSKFLIRPSGTEPKIKFYIESRGRNFEECKNKNNMIKDFIKTIL